MKHGSTERSNANHQDQATKTLPKFDLINYPNELVKIKSAGTNNPEAVEKLIKKQKKSTELKTHIIFSLS